MPAAHDTAADEFVESYVRWREACSHVRAAYDRCGCSAPRERRLAYAAYGAALEREEQAARVHSDQTTRLRAVSAC